MNLFKSLPETGSPLVHGSPVVPRRLDRNERGQATVEYILLLALVLVSSLAVNTTIIKTLDKAVVKLGAELQRNLKTGRPSETTFRFTTTP